MFRNGDLCKTPIAVDLQLKSKDVCDTQQEEEILPSGSLCMLAVPDGSARAEAGGIRFRDLHMAVVKRIQFRRRWPL